MDACSLQQSDSDVLALLPEATLGRLAPHCSRVTFTKGEVINQAGQPMTAAIFIESGIASIFRPGNPLGTEICLAGPESFLGIPLVLEDEAWPYQTIVQAEQLTGLQIDAEPLRQLLTEDADLRRVLLRLVNIRFVQVAEGLISNANQRIAGRLARWLLMYRDRLRTDRLPVTHEFMALMVGAQRTGVTAALHELEGAGLILARRGAVTIQCVPGLIALAADGYGVTEKLQARLRTLL